MSKDRAHGMLLVLLASALWSVSGPLTKLLQANGADFLDIISWRYPFGLAALGIYWAICQRRSPFLLPSRALRITCLAAGVILVVNGVFILSNFYTTVANAIALSFTAPIFAAMLGWLFLGERTRPLHQFAVLLGVAGVCVLALHPAPAAREGLVPSSNVMLGNILALFSGLTFGAYFVVARKFALEFGEVISSTMWQFLLITSAVAPVTVFTGWKGISSTNYFYLLIHGVFCTAAPILLINLAGRVLKAHESSVVALSEVPFCIFVGMLLVGEYPSVTSWAGVALIMSGTLMVGIKERRDERCIAEKSSRQNR